MSAVVEIKLKEAIENIVKYLVKCNIEHLEYDLELSNSKDTLSGTFFLKSTESYSGYPIRQETTFSKVVKNDFLDLVVNCFVFASVQYDLNAAKLQYDLGGETERAKVVEQFSKGDFAKKELALFRNYILSGFPTGDICHGVSVGVVEATNSYSRAKAIRADILKITKPLLDDKRNEALAKFASVIDLEAQEVLIEEMAMFWAAQAYNDYIDSDRAISLDDPELMISKFKPDFERLNGKLMQTRYWHYFTEAKFKKWLKLLNSVIEEKAAKKLDEEFLPGSRRMVEVELEFRSRGV